MLTPPCRPTMPMAEALVCLPCNQAILRAKTSQTWWPVSLPPGTRDSRAGTPVLPVTGILSATQPQRLPVPSHPQACIRAPNVCTHMHSHMYTWAHPCIYMCVCGVHICMHICTRVSMCAYTHVCACTVCTHERACALTHVCTHASVHKLTCVCIVCVHMCRYVSMHVPAEPHRVCLVLTSLGGSLPTPGPCPAAEVTLAPRSS